MMGASPFDGPKSAHARCVSTHGRYSFPAAAANHCPSSMLRCEPRCSNADPQTQMKSLRSQIDSGLVFLTRSSWYVGPARV